MSHRKPVTFDEFMNEVEAEARAAGPEAVAEAEALRDHFRLAAQVLRRRRELGLTQKDLAGRVGVHQSEISDIERGAASPGFRLLTKLAEGLEADFTLVPRASASRRRASPSKARTVARRASRVPAYAHTVSAKRR
jgi:ribosome-binding protein aMBF1 (putative translation factor)